MILIKESGSEKSSLGGYHRSENGGRSDFDWTKQKNVLVSNGSAWPGFMKESHDQQCPDAVNRYGRALLDSKKPRKLVEIELGPGLDSGFTSIKASESRLTASGSSAMDHDIHEEILIGQDSASINGVLRQGQGKLRQRLVKEVGWLFIGKQRLRCRKPWQHTY